jgi:hypothetical protein
VPRLRQGRVRDVPVVRSFPDEKMRAMTSQGGEKTCGYEAETKGPAGRRGVGRGKWWWDVTKGAARSTCGLYGLGCNAKAPTPHPWTCLTTPRQTKTKSGACGPVIARLCPCAWSWWTPSLPVRIISVHHQPRRPLALSAPFCPPLGWRA